jgi:hypothetical protein
VWSHKGPTLKGIRYYNHPDTGLCFPGPRSDIFRTDFVQYLASCNFGLCQELNIIIPVREMLWNRLLETCKNDTTEMSFCHKLWN